jgi:hypothetical protein
MSPILFNVNSKHLAKEVLERFGDFKRLAKDATMLQDTTKRLIQTGRCYEMEMNVEKTRVLRIPWQPSSIRIMTDQKQLENVEYFNYLGTMITNDARCIHEIKSRIDIAKATFTKLKTLFTSKLDLKLKEENIKVLHLEHSFVLCCNLGTSKSRSEIPKRFEMWS